MGETSRSEQRGVVAEVKPFQPSSLARTLTPEDVEEQQRIVTEYLSFRDLFSKNPNIKQTVADIESWLKSKGADIDKTEYHGRTIDSIAFRFGGETFMGKISPAGSIVFSRGGFGRILAVNYGTNQSHNGQPTRSREADAIWQKSSNETWVITSEPAMGDRSGSPTFKSGSEYYSEPTDFTKIDLDNGKNFILKKLVPEQVFTGSVSEGLNRIDAPYVLKVFWSSISTDSTP